MANFLKSLFLGETEESEETKLQRNFDILKYDGIKALKIGKATYAIRCFEEALKIREDKEVFQHLIEAYNREDRMEEAITTTGRLIEIEPLSVTVRLWQAHLNYTAGKYEAAIADCQEALKIETSNPQAYFLLGKAKKKAGDTVGAIVSLSQAVALKEDFAEALLLRSETLLETREYQQGLEDVEKVVKLAPEEEYVYLVRGQLQEALNHPKAAEDNYRYVTELNPFNEQAYLRLGTLFINEGQPQKAIALFDEAIELKPDFTEAYRERGRARLMNNDKEGSIEDMKKALELNPPEKINGTYSNFEEMYKNRPI